MGTKQNMPVAPAGAATAPASAAPASQAQQLQVDTHAGKGGMYELVDGQRRLVERTESAESADATPAQPAAE